MSAHSSEGLIGGVESSAHRLPTLDALRGMVIIAMALDHANFFVAQKHSSGEFWGGSFPSYNEPLPFLTRLVTHIAAPGFFFLMGAGMLLFSHSRKGRGWTQRSITFHFLLRATILICLQLLLVNRALELAPGGSNTELYFGVLYALGGCMLLGSLIVLLKPRYLLVLFLALFIVMELLHPAPNDWGREYSPLFLVTVQPGGDSTLWSNYPILPWLELVVLGILFGKWLIDDEAKAYQKALMLGVSSIVIFAIIRALNGFGNIRPRIGNDWIAFLNVVKYPPSMTFTLVTMGVNFTLLGLLSRTRTHLLRPFVIFGQVPLFFYISHLFLYATIGRLFEPAGTSIPAMIPYWILGLLLLYPICLWIGRLKRNRPDNLVLRFM